MLGTLSDWIFEVKFDGYRMLYRVDAGDVRIFSRNGLDWTSKLTRLQADIAGSGLPDGGYDEQATTEMLRFSEQIDAPPAEVMVAACQLGLEGLIGKRKDSRYVHRRSPEWIKLKCGFRQEFVVGGF